MPAAGYVWSQRCALLHGGSTPGICAGAFFGSTYVKFCKGNQVMEVVGP